MSIDTTFIHHFKMGEAVCLFNLNVEQELFSLLDINKMI